MKLFEFSAGATIFSQNDRASHFYVVSEGVLAVKVDDRVVRQLKTGDSFGELALIADCPRSATIVCVRDCVLWGLDRFTFQGVLKEMNALRYEENKAFIEQVPSFQTLTAR
jgi:CRP-like cAMP-binding protein